MKYDALPAVGMLQQDGARVVAQFEDKYEEKRVLLRTRHGLRVKRERTTDAILANQAVGPLLGARIKAERKARGWTMTRFAELLGWEGGNAKGRVWAIENSTRREGIRLGTLFHIAQAFGVPWASLLPPDEDVRQAIKAKRSAGE